MIRITGAWDVGDSVTICVGAVVELMLSLERVPLVVEWDTGVGVCHGAIVALVQLDVWVAGHGVVLA